MNRPLWRIFLTILAAVLATACSSSGDDDDSQPSADDDSVANDDGADDDVLDDDISDDDIIDDDTAECWTDLPAGEKVIFAEGFAGAEGIGFTSSGELYVSAKTGVALVQPDGSWEMVAEITYPIGLAMGPDDTIYVCDYGASVLPNVNDGAIYRIDSDYTKTLLTTGIANPNFVTFTPWGTLLVSDNLTTTIYEVTLDGALTHWFDDALMPNGMVFSPDRLTLYVAGTVPLSSPVYRVAVNEGQATGVETILHLDGAALPDGAALDENGKLYVTENGLGTIVRIDPATGVYEEFASGMTTPASIAFGRGPAFDPCSMYVTETFSSRVWRISVGVRGYPLASEE